MAQGSVPDLTGGRLFRAAAVMTLGGLLAAAWFRPARIWIALALFATWTAFSVVNALRSRRLHSMLSAPVYLAATLVVAGAAAGRIDVQIWMVWMLGAALVGANLAERLMGPKP